MATVIAGMTMSLDGFVADPSGSANPLYPDLADLRGTAYMTAAIEGTGAVLMGRRSFEMADPDSYVGSYEFQVPIFVLTRHPPETPPKQDERLTCSSNRRPLPNTVGMTSTRPRGRGEDQPQLSRRESAVSLGSTSRVCT
jgi:hypothetical protein